MTPRPTPPPDLSICPQCDAPLSLTDSRYWGIGDTVTDRWVLTLACPNRHEFAWWEPLTALLPRRPWTTHHDQPRLELPTAQVYRPRLTGRR